MRKLSTEELRSMIDEGEMMTLIDVLPEEDFKNTRIPGAVSVPLEADDFVERVEQLVGEKDQEVVVYCAGEQCPASTNAANKLEQAGFTNVFDYKGGAKAWNDSKA